MLEGFGWLFQVKCLDNFLLPACPHGPQLI